MQACSLSAACRASASWQAPGAVQLHPGVRGGGGGTALQGQGRNVGPHAAGHGGMCTHTHMYVLRRPRGTTDQTFDRPQDTPPPCPPNYHSPPPPAPDKYGTPCNLTPPPRPCSASAPARVRFLTKPESVGSAICSQQVPTINGTLPLRQPAGGPRGRSSGQRSGWWTLSGPAASGRGSSSH